MMRTHGLDDATLDWLVVYLLHTEKEKLILFKVHFKIGNNQLYFKIKNMILLSLSKANFALNKMNGTNTSGTSATEIIGGR